MATPIEIEVKFLCADIAAHVAAHPELGWEVVTSRHFEDNQVFDFQDHRLARRESILRIRIVDGRATLTYKGLVPESIDTRLKVREEIETGVESPEALATVLERLGLKRVFRYQKYRTIYSLSTSGGEVLAMRDETPMGDFLELEGGRVAIEAAINTLGFSIEERIVESYIGMQVAHCRAQGLPLRDLVFDSKRARA